MLPRLAPIARAERRQCHRSISGAPPCRTIGFLSPLAPLLRDSTCPVLLTWPSSLPKFPRKYVSVSPPKQVPEASSDEVMCTNVTGTLDKHHWWCNQNTVVFFSPTIFSIYSVGINLPLPRMKSRASTQLFCSLPGNRYA